jgi:hypothetical protein
MPTRTGLIDEGKVGNLSDPFQLQSFVETALVSSSVAVSLPAYSAHARAAFFIQIVDQIDRTLR